MGYKGFNPCFDSNAEILILGSFPSVKSREEAFYYGNPQNRFWRVVAKAFSETTPQTVDDKNAFLHRNKIALWDMVTECEITGSMDINIKNYEIADLSVVLSAAPIRKIILNGGKAADIFKKQYPNLSDTALYLPSTSPANVRFNEDLWLDALK